MSPNEINKKLIEVFGIPPNTTSATIRMKAGQPPEVECTMTLTTPTFTEFTQRFVLVPDGEWKETTELAWRYKCLCD